MGDRFEWTEKCPKCGANIEVWYAESCGVTTVTCRKCLTLFNIVMGFRLIESSGEQAEPEKATPPTEERREMVRMVDFVIHTEMCGYFGNGQADEQDKEIIRTVKLWQKIRAVILAPPEPARVTMRQITNMAFSVGEELDGGVDSKKMTLLKSVLHDEFLQLGIAVEEEK